MAYDNKDINAFGMLGFPIPNALFSNGLTIVEPIEPEKRDGVGTANFLRFPNIYYCIRNKFIR